MSKRHLLKNHNIIAFAWTKWYVSFHKIIHTPILNLCSIKLCTLIEFGKVFSRSFKLLTIFKLSKKANNNPDTVLGTNEFQNKNKLLLHLQCGKRRDLWQQRVSYLFFSPGSRCLLFHWVCVPQTDCFPPSQQCMYGKMCFMTSCTCFRIIVYSRVVFNK